MVITRAYFVLFRLEQPDAVAQQFQIFLRPLASHLRGHQLAVKGRVVVLFVRGQVEFLRGLVIVLCHIFI
jgi:hypothetical protein